MEICSWGQVGQLTNDLAHQITQADCQLNLIVAVARGGFIPARLLSNGIGVKS